MSENENKKKGLETKSSISKPFEKTHKEAIMDTPVEPKKKKVENK